MYNATNPCRFIVRVGTDCVNSRFFHTEVGKNRRSTHETQTSAHLATGICHVIIHLLLCYQIAIYESNTGNCQLYMSGMLCQAKLCLTPSDNRPIIKSDTVFTSLDRLTLHKHILSVPANLFCELNTRFAKVNWPI